VALRGLLPLLTQRPEFRRLSEQLAPAASAPVLSGVTEAARPYLLAALATEQQAPLVYVVRDNERVTHVAETLTALLGRDFTVLPWIDRDALPYERLMPDVETVQTRMRALTALARHDPVIVVCSSRALAQPTLPPSEFTASLLELRTGLEIAPRLLLEHLMAVGYEPVVEVEEVGQMSHRGGIVDFFPPVMERPIRVEFFGDEVDSIRTFDPGSQRSLNPQPSVVVGPAREALATNGPAAAQRLEALSIAGMYPDARERWHSDLESLRARQSFEDIAFYLPYLHTPASLLDYLPEEGIVVLNDAEQTAQTADELVALGEELRDHLEREGENPPGLLPVLLAPETVAARLATPRQMRFAGLTSDVEGTAHGSALAPDMSIATSYGGRTRAFAQDVRKMLRERQRVVVVSGQARRLTELFGDEALLGRNGIVMVSPEVDLPDPPEPGTLEIVHGRLPEGWHSHSLALTVFTDAEVFGWSKRRGEQRRAVTPASFLAELRPGDFVVHQDHGIGRFDGLTKIESEGVAREYLLVQYAGTDKLYIPTDQLDRITRYIGMGDAVPALSRLGGTEWARAKQRTRESVRDIAADLLRLYSIRESVAGHPFPSDDQQPWLQELEEGFPYEETPDQARAITEVKEDMERDRPMDRLVCGDVGYGKTEVALRAAFKAVLDQRQVAVLVPTTVLALQHFNTFTQRLRPYPVRVELLSRFRSEKEQREVLEDLANGKVDIVIGTHRLLQKDVAFAQLGLLIIDEEQRFGVGHKERLKQMRTEVDVLTLTATPIPRTLYMALSNVRDMSVIETPPQERLPIRTHIRESDDELIREAILREIDRGGQVFFVHNRVRGIQAIADKVRRLVPEAKVAVGHGQMPEDALEHVMLDFSAGETNVLVCTTIIENGLDIPNANTIIVNNAAFFGLSQLYQLRGRVGRAQQQAFAYFLYNKDLKLKPVAEKRLRAIYEATELGAGFRIAMKDLEIRGAGNMLGAEQSGNMNAVGYDLFTRMLAEEITRMQGNRREAPVLQPVVAIELPIGAFIPDDYINDRALKMSFYSRLANLTEPEQVEAMQMEMVDRFGAPPEPVAALLGIVRLKTEASVLGYESVSARGNEIIFKVRRTTGIDRVALTKRYGRDAHISLNEVRLSRHRFSKEPLEWLAQLHELLPLIVGAKRGTSATGTAGQ
jgi:transcription-repair coupling factor (superfamily II helicase)